MPDRTSNPAMHQPFFHATDMDATLTGGTVLLIEQPRVYEGYNEGVKTGPAGLAYHLLYQISLSVCGKFAMSNQVNSIYKRELSNEMKMKGDCHAENKV